MSDAASLDTLKDAIGVGVGGGGTFYALRWIMTWLAGRADKRQAALDDEHAALDMSWKDYRLFLERERRHLAERVEVVERQGRAAFLAFQHVAAALIRHDPQDPALQTADRIMASAFPLDFSVSMARAGGALDQASGG